MIAFLKVHIIINLVVAAAISGKSVQLNDVVLCRQRQLAVCRMIARHHAEK